MQATCDAAMVARDASVARLQDADAKAETSRTALGECAKAEGAARATKAAAAACATASQQLNAQLGELSASLDERSIALSVSKALPQLPTYSDISYLRITNTINISQTLTLATSRSQRVNPAFRI